MFYKPCIDDSEKFVMAISLDVYLKERGVSETHIENMKNKIALGERRDYKEIMVNSVNKNTNDIVYKYPIKEIEVEKIIGGSRFTVGESIYDNVYSFKKDERVRERFEDLFKIFEDPKSTLDDAKKYFANELDPIIVNYYKDKDEYYVALNGNHRALVAMIFGVEKTQAEVHYYAKDNKND